MLKDFPPLVPSQTCLSCKGCCRFYDGESAWRARTALEERGAILQEKIDAQGYLKVVPSEDKVRCCFLNEQNNRCRIYEKRLFECQLYPFLLMREGDEIKVGLHLSCPYVLDHRESDNFKEYVFKIQECFKEKGSSFVERYSCVAGDYSEFKDEIEELFVVL